MGAFNSLPLFFQPVWILLFFFQVREFRKISAQGSPGLCLFMQPLQWECSLVMDMDITYAGLCSQPDSISNHQGEGPLAWLGRGDYPDHTIWCEETHFNCGRSHSWTVSMGRAVEQHSRSHWAAATSVCCLPHPWWTVLAQWIDVDPFPFKLPLSEYFRTPRGKEASQGDRARWIFEFKASLLYTASSGLHTQDLVSKVNK